jgi:hypothetical protein
MRQSPTSLTRLQAVLNSSAAGAGAHLRETFGIPDHTLSAGQLVHYLAEPQDVAIATVTARGEPRVAPVHAVFYDAAFHIPTVNSAVRVRHVERRPAISMTHWVLNYIAIVVHGTTSILRPGHTHFADLDDLYRAAWWREARQQNDGLYLRVNAERMFAWAADPTQFADEHS